MPGNPSDPAWRRFLPEAVVLAVGLVLVVGLWLRNSDDDGVAHQAGPVTTQAPSTTAAGPGAAPLIEDGSISIEGDATSAGRLRDAVLRTADLPAGWTETALTGASSPLCTDSDPIGDSRPTAVVRAGFVRNPGSRLLAGTVAAFADEAAARGVLRRVVDESRACSTPEVTFEVEPLAGVGDEAVRISSVITIGGSKIRSLALVARRGARVAVVTGTGDPVDAELVLRALRAEVDRL